MLFGVVGDEHDAVWDSVTQVVKLVHASFKPGFCLWDGHGRESCVWSSWVEDEGSRLSPHARVCGSEPCDGPCEVLSARGDAFSAEFLPQQVGVSLCVRKCKGGVVEIMNEALYSVGRWVPDSIFSTPGGKLFLA